jgi:hypothetical protein
VRNFIQLAAFVNGLCPEISVTVLVALNAVGFSQYYFMIPQEQGKEKHYVNQSRFELANWTKSSGNI